MLRRLIVLFGGGVLLLLAGWWLLPRLITAVPSQVRYRLPSPLLVLITTPLPTALPAPEHDAPPQSVMVPTLPWMGTPLPVGAASSATRTPVPTTAGMSTQMPDVTLASTWPLPEGLLPTAVQLPGMVGVPQYFNNCGAANLTQALAYYGQDVTQKEIAAYIRPNIDDRNVSPWELVDYVNMHTPLQAETYAYGSLDLLKTLLAAGFPVIVEKGLVLEDHDGWMGHYLTLIGYEEATRQFWALDTLLGPFDNVGRSESYDDMMRNWWHFNNRFIVVYPKEQERIVHTLLGTTYLNSLTMWQLAAEQAQNTISANSADAFAWFNLGSSLTHLGELTGEPLLYENAAAAFDRARSIGLPWRMLWYQFEPYVAYLETGRVADVLALTIVQIEMQGGRYVEENYYYQGKAWLAQGDLAQARVAYQHALEVNANFAPAQTALVQLESNFEETD